VEALDCGDGRLFDDPASDCHGRVKA
jgi:hypothetical protein